MATGVTASVDHVSVSVHLLSHPIRVRCSPPIPVKVICHRRDFVPSQAFVVVRIQVGDVFNVGAVEWHGELPSKGHLQATKYNEACDLPSSPRVAFRVFPVIHRPGLVRDERFHRDQRGKRARWTYGGRMLRVLVFGLGFGWFCGETIPSFSGLTFHGGTSE